VKVPRIKRAFKISEVALEASSAEKDAAQALVDLVVEHVALLSTQL
jgi:hypothetical protein